MTGGFDVVTVISMEHRLVTGRQGYLSLVVLACLAMENDEIRAMECIVDSLFPVHLSNDRVKRTLP